MGIGKTIVNRLTDHLESKGLSVKGPLRPTAAVTASALPVPEKDEIDRMYYYYLDPLYTFTENMKKEKFGGLYSN